MFFQIKKIRLIASEEEKYETKKIKLNIALKFSTINDSISVIIFKSIIDVNVGIEILVIHILTFRVFLL